MEKGALIGHPVQGVRVVLEDGQTHTVDSSDMAFRFAALSAVREAIMKAGAQVLEPVMSVEVRVTTRSRQLFVQRDSARSILHGQHAAVSTCTPCVYANGTTT